MVERTTMPSVLEWLKMLSMEFTMMETPKRANNEPVGDGEQLLDGKLSDNTKKAWGLSHILMRDAARIALDGKIGQASGDVMSPEEEAELYRSAQIKKNQGELLREIFWIMVRQELDCWTEGSIGVREDFKIVAIKQDKHDLPPGLKRLFGIDE
jgi:hypothetical protein